MKISCKLLPAWAACLLAASGCEKPAVSFHRGEAGSWNMIVPTGFDQQAILNAVRRRCGTADICQVTAYTSEAYLKPDIPEDERWIATVLKYSRNSASGFEHLVWDCSLYPDTPEDQCRGSPIIDWEIPELKPARPPRPAA